eukprot:scaffold55213_cov64-Phaeocystis_antarctica.AAC.1
MLQRTSQNFVCRCNKVCSILQNYGREADDEKERRPTVGTDVPSTDRRPYVRAGGIPNRRRRLGNRWLRGDSENRQLWRLGPLGYGRPPGRSTRSGDGCAVVSSDARHRAPPRVTTRASRDAARAAVAHPVS